MGKATGKQNKLNAAAKQYDNESQPFQEYSDDVFDALDSDDERLPIGVIHADFTQPRRTVPKDIRGEWQGAAGNLPALLEKWRDKAGITKGVVKEILTGEAEASRFSWNNLIRTEFLTLLDLAAQIRDVGLQQPIGVRKLGGDHYEIIFGERRWMAYHALALWLGDEWKSIPAKVIKVSAWEVAKIQAAENFQRVDINAIGKARQLAKLIIRARQDTQDPAYDSWARLVVPGGCDRPWYAQVADGNKHPIPYGMGVQFEQALGISTNQMRQYRALLRLTEDHEVDNALWDLGDERDWAEQFMREIAQYVGEETIRLILKESPDVEEALRGAISTAKMQKSEQRTVTTVTHLDEIEPETTATETPAVIEDTPETVAETIPEEPIIDKTDADYWIKQAVIVRAGKNRFKGTVIEGIGNRVRVEYADGGSGWHDVWQLEEPPAVTLGEGPLKHNDRVRIKLHLPEHWHPTENPPAGTEGVVVSEKGLRGFRDSSGKLWTQFRVGTGRNQRDYEPALNHVERIPVEAPAAASTEWPSAAWVGKEAWIGSIRVDILKAVKPETVTVRQDDGREYDAHLSILYDMPPKPVKHFQPGQRVKLVRDVESPAMAAGAMGTVMRLGSAISSITGVNFDDTAGTIFSVKVDGQEEKVLELCEAVEAPSESASTTEQPDVVDMYWKPIRVGDTVKTPRGKEGVVTEIQGKVLWVDDGNTLVRVFADKVEVIVPAAPSADTPSDSPTPPETATPGTPLSATQLVSRLVTYDGQPAVVVGNVGSEQVIIQLGKERKKVPISAVIPVADGTASVTVKQAVDGPTTNGETKAAAEPDDKPDDDDFIPLFADKKHGDLYDLLIGLAQYIGDNSSITTLRKFERLTYGQARAMEAATEQNSTGVPQTLWKQNIQRVYTIGADIIENAGVALLRDLETWLDEVEAEGKA